MALNRVVEPVVTVRPISLLLINECRLSLGSPLLKPNTSGWAQAAVVEVLFAPRHSLNAFSVPHLEGVSNRWKSASEGGGFCWFSAKLEYGRVTASESCDSV